MSVPLDSTLHPCEFCVKSFIVSSCTHYVVLIISGEMYCHLCCGSCLCTTLSASNTSAYIIIINFTHTQDDHAAVTSSSPEQTQQVVHKGQNTQTQFKWLT